MRKGVGVIDAREIGMDMVHVGFWFCAETEGCIPRWDLVW